VNSSPFSIRLRREWEDTRNGRLWLRAAHGAHPVSLLASLVSPDRESGQNQPSSRDAQFIHRRGRESATVHLDRFRLEARGPPVEAAEPRLEIRLDPLERPTPAIWLQRGGT
jgi:hypothetical protein